MLLASASKPETQPEHRYSKQLIQVFRCLLSPLATAYPHLSQSHSVAERNATAGYASRVPSPRLQSLCAWALISFVC